MRHKIRLGPIAVFMAVIAAVVATLAILTFATSRADVALAERFAAVTAVRYELDEEGGRFLQAVEEAGAQTAEGRDEGERAAQAAEGQNEDERAAQTAEGRGEGETAAQAAKGQNEDERAAQTAEGRDEDERAAQTAEGRDEGETAAQAAEDQTLPDTGELTGEVTVLDGGWKYYAEKDGYALTVEVVPAWKAASADSDTENGMTAADADTDPENEPADRGESGSWQIRKWKINKLWEGDDPFEDLWLG